MHTIYIRDLELKCIVGIYDWERETQQDVRINVRMKCDAPEAAESDRIEATVDYKAINKRIIALVEGSAYQLIEALAGAVMECCLEDPRVTEVTVTVDKPGALRHARSVAVEMTAIRP